MVSKAAIALAVASLAGQAFTESPHGHIHQQLHKRAYTTDWVTETIWTTLTVKALGLDSATLAADGSLPVPSTPADIPPTQPSPPQPEDSSTSLSTSSDYSSTGSSSSYFSAALSVNPTAADASAEHDGQQPKVQATNTLTALASSDTHISSSGSGSGSGSAKRGLAYNWDSQGLVDTFLGTGNKIAFTYDWDNKAFVDTGIEFCPMLWGIKRGEPDTWHDYAQQAIDAGSPCVLSFNEPDIVGQAELTPAVAAENHIKYINQYQSPTVKVSTPAISAGEGTDPLMGRDWLRQWIAACNGKCNYDVIAAHIYDKNLEDFLSYLLDLHDEFQKPIWLTEFAFNQLNLVNHDVSGAVQEIITQFETNSTFSFIERYVLFYAGDGQMYQNGAITDFARTFVYNSA